MKIFNHILLLFFVFCSSLEYLISQIADPAVPSKEFSVQDYRASTEVTLRSVDTDKIVKYKNDPDFQYDRALIYEMTIWERITEWIKNLLRTLLFTEKYSDIADIILYAVMGITLITIIFFIYRTEVRNIFSKDVNNPISYLEITENIHNMDFDELIAKQLNERNYRFALRLTYLKLLKVLDSIGYIKWRDYKTNHEMINQIKSKELNAALRIITFEFETVWYGGFDVDEDNYKNYISLYNKIFEIVKQ